MKGGGEMAVAAMKGVVMFHVKRDGKVYGPFDSAKLKEMAASGRLLKTDMISDGTKWGPASAAKGLVFKETVVELPMPQQPVQPSQYQQPPVQYQPVQYQPVAQKTELHWVIRAFIGAFIGIMVFILFFVSSG